MVEFSTRDWGGAIPRALYQTFSTSELTPELEKNVEELRYANPKWEYRLYDDKAVTRFILDRYGRDVLKLFEKISPAYGAARADLFRYLLIYDRGGIYLDVKSRFVVPISSVVSGHENYVLSRWRNAAADTHAGWGLHAELSDVPGGEFQQWHVIAAPGHPFLRAVIERVLHGIETYRVRDDETGWLGVLRLTGPIAYTLAIAPLIDRYPCRVVPDESAIGLEYNALGGSKHKALFKRHYTRSTLPVVARPFPRGWWDRLYVFARTRRRAWRNRS